MNIGKFNLPGRAACDLRGAAFFPIPPAKLLDWGGGVMLLDVG